MVIIMKDNRLDHQIKKGLQEQVGLFADPDSGFDKILDRLQETKMEEKKMKHFNMKKAVIAAAAAVMVLGTISIASGIPTSIVSHTLAFPDYTKYTDLEKAEAAAGVTTNAPEEFSNGYKFSGINLVDYYYETDDNVKTDSFKSISIEYKKSSDNITYDVQPRPSLIQTENHPYDIFEQNGITYYYIEMRNKWVPVGYEPTAEENAQMEAGTLNIGCGVSEISYSDSKSLIWEINGHEHSLFCMDNDISKEELIAMALEIE